MHSQSIQLLNHYQLIRFYKHVFYLVEQVVVIEDVLNSEKIDEIVEGLFLYHIIQNINQINDDWYFNH